MKRTLTKLGALLFAGLFLLSAYKLGDWYLDGLRTQREFQQLEALVGSAASPNGVSGGAEDAPAADTPAEDAQQPEAEPEILSQYLAVYGQNSDFVGWVSIEDTQINYPVVQSRDDPDFYLKHNFEKQYSDYGTPFLQSDCDLLTSDNLLLYGHSMKNGTMFTNLRKYKSADFCREHSVIRFDTKYSCGTYEVIAAFATTANDGGFAYNAFVNAADAADFDAYVAQCKALTPYEIDSTASYGDRLITLTTCEYTHDNGRFVVVARQISE